MTTLIKRREFLQTSGTFTVAFGWWGSPLFTNSSGGIKQNVNVPPQASSLDSWLQVGSDGTVTVFTSKVDLGTGVLTALSQIVAEELDVSFHRIRMITGDTAQTIDQSQTSGSRTVHKAGPQLREAAAAARNELLRQASQRLGLPANSLTVVDGDVSSIKDKSQSVSYWELIGDKRFNVTIFAQGSGADLTLAPEIPIKNPKDYRIVGTSVQRADLPAKFAGEFTYSQDIRLKGMLHGRIVRPNAALSHPTAVDEASIADLPGIVDVVRIGSLVGVVATTEWAAIQAANKLKIAWSEPSLRLPSTTLYEYLGNTKSFQEQVVADGEESPSMVSGDLKTFEATYRWPFQMHGMIGPSCAVADVRQNTAQVWTGSQGTHRTRKAIADLLGFAEKDVRIIYVEGSGCYGRLCPDDVAEDAVLLSRSVGHPVRVQWMRQDEHIWEPKASAQLIHVRASVDDQGSIVLWNLEDRYFPYTAGVDNRLLASRQVGMPQNGLGNPGHGFTYGKAGGGDLYRFSNQRIVSPVVPWIQNDLTPLRTCNLRAPGVVARTFASESFIDEIASDLNIDPVEYRLGLTVNDERTHEILKTAAKKVGWKARPSRARYGNDIVAEGQGVACSNRDGTIVAAIAEIAVDRKSGKICVRRITVAHDCGMMVNPDGVRNQIEGNVLQGISRALLEEVVFDERTIKNVDWANYETLRFEDVPEVDIVLIDRPELGFLGVGEAAIIPVPAAIANALFDATGLRFRSVPLTRSNVLRVLET